MRISILCLLALAGCSAPLASPGMFQPATEAPEPPAAPTGLAAVTPEMVSEAIATGVAALVAMQEGENNDQWPYEGVYRVRGQIPVGYGVGGTAIVVRALLQAPGYADDKPRQEAVARAVAFVCEARRHALMSVDDYEAGYDVRAWGYIEGILCLCRLKAAAAAPAGQEAEVWAALEWYVAALQKIEMPGTGGWNYARPEGRDTAGSPSSFMTATALQALFEAAKAGVAVDAAVVERSLTVLEKARGPSGTFVYSGAAEGRARLGDATPGAVGRMTSAEATLLLAGRNTPRDVRGSVDAFLTHWAWLEQRRAKPGTHVAPYMVAPYYFMFAHLYAAQAVELLPGPERGEYRRRIRELLFHVRSADGTWNDRVFPRSRAYGTAMALLALMQPEVEKPARWEKK